ncbi:MAG: hypothetical protein CMG66_01525 [Candidatus Marinimicrobia bacterium]|nr:hypothetical protein [Candidatus Neomarinimicrobiota bacterium]|tara:strand:- start:48092 stop:48790 length:699 start_codon:yes stop_codon:yes gene_type:complete
MKNNFFSVVLINQKSKQNFSINLSKHTVYLILLLCCSCFVSFIILVYQAYYQIPNIKQHAIIHNNKKDIIVLLNELKDENLITDSTLLKYKLLNEYDSFNQIAPIVKPVEGIITRGVNTQKKHYGIDIAASLKSDVHATQDGIVILSDETKKLGKTIIIAHPNNYYSIYGHLYKTKCTAREFIKKGQTIGLVGQADSNEGPHLHFEIWKNNIIIDPRNLIKEYKENDVSIKE